MDRLLVFGTGSVAEKFLSMVDCNKVDILAFINTKTTATKFHEYDIIRDYDIKNMSYDYIVIASGYTLAIRKILENVGAAEDKIISYIFDDYEVLDSLGNIINEELDKKFNRGHISRWLKDGYNLPRFSPAVLWDEERNVKRVYKDFVREQTIALCHEVISQMGIKGSVAELGVFRGDFTVVLNDVFKDKRIYLFDTFSGFDEKDVAEDDTVDNKMGEKEKFKDTSPDYVLTRLKYRDNVVVKKGYFPDTYDLEDEVFSFVSIDLNLTKPTKDALDIFWPRMELGGVYTGELLLCSLLRRDKKGCK